MIMRLIVKITTKEDGERIGVGNFADLAGSEKVKKTGAKGQRLKEAQGILSSLSTLAAVIDSLVRGKLPPFKESKLTFALKDSLGGNSKTALLIACSPHVFNRVETVNSLQFGRRCRRIKNKAKVNVKMTREQLERENEKLQEQIKRLLIGKKSQKPSVDPEIIAQSEQEMSELREEIARLNTANQQLTDELKERDSIQLETEEKLQNLNELTATLISKDDELSKLNEQCSKYQTDHQRITTQLEELQVNHKQLTQRESQWIVEKQRLMESNRRQTEEVLKWKREVESIREAQNVLRNKWSAEFESKKSQFTQRELQMSQQLEALQSAYDKEKSDHINTQRELKVGVETLQHRQERIYELEDEVRSLRSQLEDSKVGRTEMSSENDRLKSVVEGLESKVRTLGLENERRNNVHNSTLDDLSLKLKSMECQMEKKSATTLELQERIKAMERAHALEMKQKDERIQSLFELNATLKEENMAAVDVMNGQKKRVEHQRETLSTVQDENAMIAQQLEQLQSHYSKVVQQQIEGDAKYARELEQREKDEYRRMRRKHKSKTKNGSIDDSDEEFLMNGHTTPGMPSISIEFMNSDGDSNHSKEAIQETKDDSESEFDSEEEFMEMGRKLIQHKQTKSRLMLQGMDDDDDRKQQMAQYTEEFSYVDTDREYALKMQKQQLHKHQKSWIDHAIEERERLRRAQEERRRYLRNSVSVADLDNNDQLTPRGKRIQRDSMKVKPMKDRVSMDLGSLRQMDIEDDEDEMLIAE